MDQGGHTHLHTKKDMNHEDGSYQLRHAYNCFLGTAATCSV